MTRRPTTNLGRIDSRALDSRYRTNSRSRHGTRADVVKLDWTAAEAATASTTGVHAAGTGYGTGPVTVNTGITNPPCARNITATSGGTAGDIKAGQVEVFGTDIDDQPISELLPTFTVD